MGPLFSLWLELKSENVIAVLLSNAKTESDITKTGNQN